MCLVRYVRSTELTNQHWIVQVRGRASNGTRYRRVHWPCNSNRRFPRRARHTAHIMTTQPAYGLRGLDKLSRTGADQGFACQHSSASGPTLTRKELELWRGGRAQFTKDRQSKKVERAGQRANHGNGASSAWRLYAISLRVGAARTDHHDEEILVHLIVNTKRRDKVERWPSDESASRVEGGVAGASASWMDG